MGKANFVFGIFILATVFQSEALWDVAQIDSLHFGEPYSPFALDRLGVVTEEFITQRLDNFDPQKNRSFEMRYFQNQQYATEGGPILLYLGGEWEITKGILLTSHIHDMAKEMNGLIVYLEHRFYGQTQPTTKLDIESLKYLSVDQALADVAHFITELKADPKYEHSSVVVIGGSYSATMAIWFRQKYPHLAVGAWASSAPVLAKVDFTEYKEIVGQSIATVAGTNCIDVVREGIARAEELLENGEFKEFRKTFHLCDDFDHDDTYNIWTLFGRVSNVFASVVQKHQPGKIQGLCDILAPSNATIADANTTALESFSRFYKKYFVGSDDKCVRVSYDGMLEAYSSKKYLKNHYRQWRYQTCSEFGWYQTSGSSRQPFGTLFPVELYARLCKDIFGQDFTNGTLPNIINRKNTLYGGLNPAVTNVIFTHGELDPWRAMGIQKDLNRHSPAIIIPGASHCHDFAPINLEKNSREMIFAKVAIRNAIRSWV